MMYGQPKLPAWRAWLISSYPRGPRLALSLLASGPDFAPIEPARFRVDRDPERIAIAHHVDFRPAGRAVGRKQVAGRNGVGAVRLGFDPKNLSAQIVGVARRFAGRQKSHGPAVRRSGLKPLDSNGLVLSPVER